MPSVSTSTTSCSRRFHRRARRPPAPARLQHRRVRQFGGALALLDGVVDVYMPDMKYADATLARRYSHVPDYVTVNRAAAVATLPRGPSC